MTRMIALLPLLALAACGSGGGADEAEKKDPVALVRTAAATTGATATEIAAYGTVEPGPGGSRTLSAPAEAIVGRILAPNGTAVAAGQPIVLLEPSHVTANEIAKAQADAVQAQAAYLRAQRLRADGLVSDADVETARAAADTARAARANLGVTRGGTMLRAPIAGIVQGLTAKSGDQLAAGAAIATVADRANLRAHFAIDPITAQRVKVGDKLTLDDVSGTAHATAIVAGVDTQADPTTRLAAVYATIPHGFAAGLGQALRGTLTLSSQTSGVIVPYAALLDDGGRSYVFVVKGGVAHERPVAPGSSTRDTIQIRNGLAAGEKVVTEGGTALEDGMKVTEQGAAR